ncbi:iron-sulfur cluster assembly protein [uncultured Sphaerotilus sp.]|uniref:iron-sulfur cluster assembly protein n=1 Tax=uncultured Sphaerotilus sp. TaxID=474984 RepID=UPI0030CA5A1E
MSLVHRPIWMHVAPNGQAKSPPVEPVWVGEPVLLDKVVHALRRVREAQGGPDIVSSGRVRSLEITPDEVVLTMHLGGGHCGSAQVLAELAFDVLREQLPDTDLYLRHEHSGGCPTA